MPAEPLDPQNGALDAGSSTDDGVDAAQRAVKDALAAAERGLTDAAKRVERVIKDGMDALRAQTSAYSGPASQTVDDAQRYVIERVKERPVTATLAGLGVGVLIGLLLSSRGK